MGVCAFATNTSQHQFEARRVINGCENPLSNVLQTNSCQVDLNGCVAGRLCNEGTEVHHLFFRGRERTTMPHRAECKVVLEAGLVASACKCCHPLLHRVVGISGQRSRARCETGVATERDRAATCQNLVTCKRDKASAILLSVPGT